MSVFHPSWLSSRTVFSHRVLVGQFFLREPLVCVFWFVYPVRVLEQECLLPSQCVCFSVPWQQHRVDSMAWNEGREGVRQCAGPPVPSLSTISKHWYPVFWFTIYREWLPLLVNRIRRWWPPIFSVTYYQCTSHLNNLVYSAFSQQNPLYSKMSCTDVTLSYSESTTLNFLQTSWKDWSHVKCFSLNSWKRVCSLAVIPRMSTTNSQSHTKNLLQSFWWLCRQPPYHYLLKTF